MKGQAPTLKDIVLELEEAILPQNLLSNESLSLDDAPEEEHLLPYKVDSYCYKCNRRVRIVVVSSAGSIRLLEELLSTSLFILCPGCSRGTVRHGRS
uniref:Protein E7 n=1 Tax=Human papillomavirus TaxID=10566 RepID=A0A385PKA0_9PAPI|nr:MAG: E7 protein [Human papillomavirus]